jgi:hypothetical protein
MKNSTKNFNKNSSNKKTSNKRSYSKKTSNKNFTIPQGSTVYRLII